MAVGIPSEALKPGKREGLLRMVNSIGANENETIEAEDKQLATLKKAL